MVRSRRLMVVLVSVFLAAGAASACAKEIEKPNGFAGDGQPNPPPPVGGGEGGAVEGGVDASGDSGDAGACNTLILTGTLVDRIGIVGDPPVSSGGTVVDGDYDLILYSVYVGAGGVGGPTGLTARSTLRIAAGKIDQITETGGSSPLKVVRSRSAYNATAATFATTELCPNTGGGAQHQFTAVDPQLVLTDLVTKEAFTFTKR
jgi:hypothetical protein